MNKKKVKSFKKNLTDPKLLNCNVYHEVVGDTLSYVKLDMQS